MKELVPQKYFQFSIKDILTITGKYWQDRTVTDYKVIPKYILYPLPDLPYNNAAAISKQLAFSLLPLVQASRFSDWLYADVSQVAKAILHL